jgi:K+/H+ antiporter YhaU regulatory subunit KhtT
MGAGTMFNLLKKSRVVTIAEGLEVFRVAVPEALVGVPIAQSGIREKTGCTIVAVKGEAGLDINPAAQSKLLANHEMVLVGDAESRARFFDTFGQH